MNNSKQSQSHVTGQEFCYKNLEKTGNMSIELDDPSACTQISAKHGKIKCTCLQDIRGRFSTTPISAKHGKIKCTCCSRKIPGIIIKYGGKDERTSEDEVPQHMPCMICGKFLGHLEVDNHDVLSGMCIDCFQEEIEESLQ